MSSKKKKGLCAINHFESGFFMSSIQNATSTTKERKFCTFLKRKKKDSFGKVPLVPPHGVINPFQQAGNPLTNWQRSSALDDDTHDNRPRKEGDLFSNACHHQARTCPPQHRVESSPQDGFIRWWANPSKTTTKTWGRAGGRSSASRDQWIVKLAYFLRSSWNNNNPTGYLHIRLNETQSRPAASCYIYQRKPIPLLVIISKKKKKGFSFVVKENVDRVVFKKRARSITNRASSSNHPDEGEE